MRLTCGEKTMTMNTGETAMRCLLSLCGEIPGLLAAQCGGEVIELNQRIDEDCTLIPLTLRDEEGRRIYERSLRFVMLLALRRLYPGQQVRIEYSVGYGVFVRLPGKELDEAQLAALEAEMRAIIAQDMPFIRQEWTVRDAKAYFEADGQKDKIALLNNRPLRTIAMYGCGGMWEYFYGAMAPSTGYVKVFGLTRHEQGFILRLPTGEHPDEPAPHVHRPKHLAVFEQSAQWCRILGVVNAPDVTRLVKDKKLRSFIRVNEALHDKAIADIADVIVRNGRRIVLVAGPSSSGKTTFTGRLAVHLQALGLRPVVISLDNYYRNRDELPVEPDGSIDLEALDTIDTALFQQQMAALMRGETVEIPRFDFVTSRRRAQGVPAHLEADQPVLVEGIHGLNPALSDHLPQELIHRIFVSALTCINLDDHNRIRTTDVRLLRRIVRDRQFRGTPAEETLSMWPSVRRGEETWIFPHQERADSMFNTALHYELPVLRHFAYGVLSEISPDSPNYLAARRLRKVLNYFPEISADALDEIPPLSLEREFIGGCTIDKE